MLSDEATEHLQGSLAILLGKNLPEPVQGEALSLNRLRRKRGRAGLPGMVPLLEWRYDELDTNRRASKKQKPILSLIPRPGRSIRYIAIQGASHLQQKMRPDEFGGFACLHHPRSPCATMATWAMAARTGAIQANARPPYPHDLLNNRERNLVMTTCDNHIYGSGAQVNDVEPITPNGRVRSLVISRPTTPMMVGRITRA